MRNLILILTLLTGTSVMQGQAMNFMTYNIRYATVNDGADQWENRKDHVCDLIAAEDPVVFGIQEGLHEQVQYMDQKLDAYEYLGVGRDSGKAEGEYCAVFYKRTELEVLESGTFWLSESPEEPSLGWDAAYKRICTYALFEHPGLQKRFWLLNTHFDHLGTEARYKSAELLLKKVKRINKNDLPVILMGDFNLNDDTEAIKLIRSSLEDSRMAAEKLVGPEATFNGFDLQKVPAERIDYIFTSKEGMRIVESRILDKKYNGRYPSDHFPVTAVVEFAKD